MYWIPINKAALKYDLHPLTLMKWIEKDEICGTLIGDKWFVDISTIQEFIGEHYPNSLSVKKTLQKSLEKLKKEIAEEAQKDKHILFLLCSLDRCAPVFDAILKEMADTIEDSHISNIFYSLSTENSPTKVAKEFNISVKQAIDLYNHGVNIIHDNWKNLFTCKCELQELKIRCRNYENMLQYLSIQKEEDPSLLLWNKVNEIPLEYSKLLQTSLTKYGINTKTTRLLRKYNIYLLEDLLRFIKKNGFDALGKLEGIGPLSCNQLLKRLIETQVMEDKDNCIFFQYLIV